MIEKWKKEKINSSLNEEGTNEKKETVIKNKEKWKKKKK